MFTVFFLSPLGDYNYLGGHFNCLYFLLKALVKLRRRVSERLDALD